MPSIDTEALSARYRARALDLAGRRLRVTNFHGTLQERDLSEPANCRGLGRIRHFRRSTAPGWPPNPLPIDPACRALGRPPADELRAQVFQSAACNWRCWYCYVPFTLLSASPAHSELVGCAELVDLFLDQGGRPDVLDLTGGQPDLVPEWVPWIMAELRARGLEGQIYLWSDDNLSNDYLWRYLSDADLELMATFAGYGRVVCFKGFDAESFAFNTAADPTLFERQFELMGRLMELGIDLYAYATFTTPPYGSIPDQMRRFVDRLQELDESLPLRTVPLEVRSFTPVEPRLADRHRRALVDQKIAVEAWLSELGRRFRGSELRANITEVSLSNRGWADGHQVGRHCAVRAVR